MLRIHRMLDTQRGHLLSDLRRLPYRFLWMVLPLHLFSNTCCVKLSLLSSKHILHSDCFVKTMSYVPLVLPLHRGTGVHQQLYQPSHLRRQVPRVPARRQTSDGEAETK